MRSLGIARVVFRRRFALFQQQLNLSSRVPRMVPNWLIVLLAAALVLTIVAIVRRDRRRDVAPAVAKGESWKTLDGGDMSGHHHHGSAHDSHASDGGHGHGGDGAGHG